MTTELRQTDVDLSGLLEILGNNLYSTPQVAIRELVQNAHDACVRRQIETAWEAGSAKIRVRCDVNMGEILITDNGAGLTRNEITQYLATIGAGYTRTLRGVNESSELIGQFGLGFLSAYVVADRVELVSTSYQDPDTAWRFTSKGGQRYALDRVAPVAIGTQIRLTLNNDYRELASGDLLKSILQRYCCLLPMDLYFGAETEPLNVRPPWGKRTQGQSPLQLAKRRREFAETFETAFEPLATIPIAIDDDGELGSVQGLLWIKGGSYYATSDDRSVTLFVRNMHITDELRDLLPTWAGFVGCVVSTSALAPTASREDVQRDSRFERIAQGIRTALINGLRTIEKDEPSQWRRILTRHNESLRGAALGEPALFEVLADTLKLPTSEGELSLPTILRQTGGGNLRITLEAAGGYEELVCRTQRIPVIYGYRYAVLPFCREYELSHPVSVSLLGTSEGSASLFKKAHCDAATVALYRQYFASDTQDLVLSEFQPSYLPLVIVRNEDVALKRRIESDESDKRIGTAALALARQFTATIEREHETTAYINLLSPITQRFPELTPSRRHAVAELLTAFSGLLADADQRNESAGELLQAFSTQLLTLCEVA